MPRKFLASLLGNHSNIRAKASFISLNFYSLCFVITLFTCFSLVLVQFCIVQAQIFEVVFSFDPEIERTARKSRKRVQEQEAQLEEGIGETSGDQPQAEITAEVNPRVLHYFALPNTTDSQTRIARKLVNASNFEIKPSLIQMIRQNQFDGNANEDPNIYLANFSKICDTIKFNGATDDAIKLRLFPF